MQVVCFNTFNTQKPCPNISRGIHLTHQGSASVNMTHLKTVEIAPRDSKCNNAVTFCLGSSKLILFVRASHIFCLAALFR